MSISLSSSSTSTLSELLDIQTRLDNLETIIEDKYDSTTSIPANKIAGRIVTNTEYDYLHGLTDNIQAQLTSLGSTSVSYIDAIRVGGLAAVTNTEFNTLRDITTEFEGEPLTIQKQLDDLSDRIPTSTGTPTTNINANQIAGKQVTNTMFDSLRGMDATLGSIQVQLNQKAPKTYTNFNANQINTNRTNTLGEMIRITTSEFSTLSSISTDKSIQTQLDALSVRISAIPASSGTSILPTGTILFYGVNTDTPPAGFLLCRGQRISKTTYVELYNLIGNTYIVGHAYSSTHFYIPDLRGMFLRGFGTNLTYVIPDNPIAGSSVVGGFQTDSVQNHTHTYNQPTVSKTVLDDCDASGKSHQTVWDNTTTVTDSSGLGLYTETRPYCLTVNYLIKI